MNKTYTISDHVSVNIKDEQVYIREYDKLIYLVESEVDAIIQLWNDRNKAPEDKYMEQTHMNYMDEVQVQFVLDQKEPGDELKVIFRKVDGTQRLLKGTLIPNESGYKKEAIPMDTSEGIRSFRKDRVLFIA